MMQSWYLRNLLWAEIQCDLFRCFAPTGQDSLAQGTALGDVTTNNRKPQRGVTPWSCRWSFAPLGLAGSH